MMVRLHASGGRKGHYKTSLLRLLRICTGPDALERTGGGAAASGSSRRNDLGAQPAPYSPGQHPRTFSQAACNFHRRPRRAAIRSGELYVDGRLCTDNEIFAVSNTRADAGTSMKLVCGTISERLRTSTE